MSSVLIISIIVVVLVTAVGYAFVFQTMDNKRKQRHRVVSALKQRATNFAYMIEGFPEGFLTKDLTALVFRCLIDVYEQLSKLDPTNDLHIAALEKYRAAMVKAQERSNNAQKVKLTSLQQIKEVRTHLQELHKFVEKLMQKRTLTGAQAKVYSKQIQKLILQITIDSYLMNAKQAQQNGKERLALHHYSLARKLLVRGNTDKAFSKNIDYLDTLISELETKVIAQSNAPTTAEGTPAPIATKEWDEFENGEGGWKKKTVYD